MVTIPFTEPELWDYVRASHIATNIDEAFCVSPEDRGDTVRDNLLKKRFDQAPVRVAPDRVIGWVATSGVKDYASVRQTMTSLEDSAIVSIESPIAHVLQLLSKHGLVFTVANRGISGFIVHSDLDRQPARTYFYLLVAGIEILLAGIVRLNYAPNAISKALTRGAAKEYNRALAANTETHPVEYLYLPKLVSLFIGSPAVAELKILNDASVRWLGSLNQFRRLVMHPACSIAASRSPADIAEFTQMAADIIGRLQRYYVDS